MNYCQLLKSQSNQSDKTIAGFIESINKASIFSGSDSKNDVVDWIQRQLFKEGMPFSEISTYFQALAYLLYPHTLQPGEHGYLLPISRKEGKHTQNYYVFFPFNPQEVFPIFKDKTPDAFVELATLFLKTQHLKVVDRADSFPDSYSEGMATLALSWINNKNPSLMWLGALLLLSCPKIASDKVNGELLLRVLPSLLNMTHQLKEINLTEAAPLLYLISKYKAAFQKDPCFPALDSLYKELANTLPRFKFWILELIKTKDERDAQLAYELYEKEMANLSDEDHQAILKLTGEQGRFLDKAVSNQKLSLNNKRLYFITLFDKWSKEEDFAQNLITLFTYAQKIIDGPPGKPLFTTALTGLVCYLALHGKKNEWVQLLNILSKKKDLWSVDWQKIWIESIGTVLPRKGDREMLGTLLEELVKAEFLNANTEAIQNLKVKMILDYGLGHLFLQQFIDKEASILYEQAFQPCLDLWLDSELEKEIPHDYVFTLLRHGLSHSSINVQKKRVEEVCQLVKKQHNFKEETIKRFHPFVLKISGMKLDKPSEGIFLPALVGYLQKTTQFSWDNLELSFLVTFCLLHQPLNGEMEDDIFGLLKLKPLSRETELQGIEFVIKHNRKEKENMLWSLFAKGTDEECKRFNAEFVPSMLSLMNSDLLDAENIIYSRLNRVEIIGETGACLIHPENKIGLSMMDQSYLIHSLLSKQLEHPINNAEDLEQLKNCYLLLAPSLFSQPNVLEECLNVLLDHIFMFVLKPTDKKKEHGKALYCEFQPLLNPKYVLNQAINLGFEELNPYLKSVLETDPKEFGYHNYYTQVMRKCLLKMKSVDFATISSVMRLFIFNMSHYNSSESEKELEEMLWVYFFCCPPDTKININNNILTHSSSFKIAHDHQMQEKLDPTLSKKISTTEQLINIYYDIQEGRLNENYYNKVYNYHAKLLFERLITADPVYPDYLYAIIVLLPYVYPYQEKLNPAYEKTIQWIIEQDHEFPQTYFFSRLYHSIFLYDTSILKELMNQRKHFIPLIVEKSIEKAKKNHFSLSIDSQDHSEKTIALEHYSIYTINLLIQLRRGFALGVIELDRYLSDLKVLIPIVGKAEKAPAQNKYPFIEFIKCFYPLISLTNQEEQQKAREFLADWARTTGVKFCRSDLISILPLQGTELELLDEDLILSQLKNAKDPLVYNLFIHRLKWIKDVNKEKSFSTYFREFEVLFKEFSLNLEKTKEINELQFFVFNFCLTTPLLFNNQECLEAQRESFCKCISILEGIKTEDKTLIENTKTIVSLFIREVQQYGNIFCLYGKNIKQTHLVLLQK